MVQSVNSGHFAEQAMRSHLGSTWEATMMVPMISLYRTDDTGLSASARALPKHTKSQQAANTSMPCGSAIRQGCRSN